MGCSKKRFNKTKICSGDLRHRIQVLNRILGTPGPDDTVPPITLSLIKEPSCGIKTKSGTPRHDGVNINDVRTHVFTTRTDAVLNFLDEGDTFIRLTRLGVSRLFRILNIKINDEDPYFLEFSATERGIEPALAALA
jgi:hypothetical protein